MNVNIWDVLDDIKSLILKKTVVDLNTLIDPQASLGGPDQLIVMTSGRPLPLKSVPARHVDV